MRRSENLISTMKKFQITQSHVYSIMDKLGPVRNPITKRWWLGSLGIRWEELVGNLRKELNIPHQPVIRDWAESAKMTKVYDWSVNTSSQVPSLNDCLEVGPPLQLIFDILLQNRLKLLCITGDLQKAFLQINVDPKDRDVHRLLWYQNLDSRVVR